MLSKCNEEVCRHFKDSEFSPLKYGTRYADVFLIVWLTYILLLFLKVQIMSVLTDALMRIK